MFDFDAFKSAFTGGDLDAWASFYGENAEWIEYRHFSPPSAPNRMIGRERIREFIEGVLRACVGVEISDDLVSTDRAAFRVTASLADGRQIIEHVMIWSDGNRVTRQVDVEAWDPEP